MDSFDPRKPICFYGVFSHLLLFALALCLFSGNAFATGSLSLAWDASPSTDVAGYKLYYGPSSKNYTSSIDVGNLTTYQLTGLTSGAAYYFALKAYNNARSIESAYSNEVNATVPAAAVALSAAFSANITRGTSPLTVIFTPGANASGTVTQWKWSFPGASITSVTNTTAAPVTVTYTTPGTYSAGLTVTGPSGSMPSTQPNYITVTAPTTVTPTTNSVPSPTGTCSSGARLVAAYGFDEIGGATAADATGNQNNGTITGANWVVGRYGNGLSFNGVNNWVTVNNSASLGLSTCLTIEAWVQPLAVHTSSVVVKEQTGGVVYGQYAYDNADYPSLTFNDGTAYHTVLGPNQLPLNQWSHLATTYDGQYERLYVNGALVSTIPQTGLIGQSNGVLRIGGNSVWGQYFQGIIDEVRVYNYALSGTQVLSDLKTAIRISNPPQFDVGNNVLEPSVDSTSQGMAEAFMAVPPKNTVVTAIQVYLDASSSTTQVVAGIYSDNNGHPGILISQGKQSVLKNGATNTVPIPTANLIAGKHYWIAILGPTGRIGFRDLSGGAGQVPTETSASSALSSLPGQWATGNVYPTDGPMSVYGTGY